MITKEQLKREIDSVEDNQMLEQVYLLIQNLKLSVVAEKTKPNRQQQQIAMDAFFGLHKEQGIDSVEDELRIVRRGRQGVVDDI